MVNYTLVMAVVIDELGITNLDDQAEPNIIRTKISESTPKFETKHINLKLCTLMWALTDHMHIHICALTDSA